MDRISLQHDDLEGANNVYLFATGTRTVLVDTGSYQRREALATALAARELSVADIDEVFLTHWHPDHSGLAKTIQEESNAVVRVHERDAPLVRGADTAWNNLHEKQRACLEAWGVPAEKRRELFEHRQRDEASDRPAVSSVTPFQDGAEFEIGDRTLSVLHTPGHTVGSCCFVIDGGADREVITGDTVLPQYTPNIGGSDTRLDRPLDRYLSSLRVLIEEDFEYAWPGHRSPITEPDQRIREILTHHEQRAGRVIEILHRSGPADVWSVSRELFGSLERFHILVGAGEAYAHLDHLRHQGVVRRENGEYRLDERQEDIDPNIDRWPLSVSSRDHIDG